MRKRVTAESVVEQTAAWGILTVGLLARSRFGGDTAAARQMLGTLSRSGALHRHLCRVPGEGPCVAYYTTATKPAGLFALRDRYAIARWCVERTPPATLMPPAALAAVMAPVMALAGASAAPMEHAPCVVEGAEGGGFRLCRMVALRDRDAGDAMPRLERLVNTEAFAPWWWFAKSGKLMLVVLMPGRAGSAELSRWLARRPLVARRQDQGVVVPVRVETAARLRA